MTTLRYLRPAMEEQSDGNLHREREHVLYAKLSDFEVLKGAQSMEHQEQWEVKIPKTEKNAAEGKFRIRKTVKGGGAPEYVLTTKVNASSDRGDNLEVSVPTTEANFAQFKALAHSGMIKDRFFFPVEGSELVWEVDVFYVKGSQPGSGQYEQWVKIDLEVPDLETPLPPLPQGFGEVISAPYGKRTEQEEARVTSLYHNEFIMPNPFLQKQA